MSLPRAHLAALEPSQATEAPANRMTIIVVAFREIGPLRSTLLRFAALRIDVGEKVKLKLVEFGQSERWNRARFSGPSKSPSSET